MQRAALEDWPYHVLQGTGLKKVCCHLPACCKQRASASIMLSACAAAQAATKPGASWGPAGRAKVPDAAWAKQPRQASVGPQPADSSDQPSSSMSKQRSSSQQPRPGSAAAGGVKPQQRSVRAGSVDSNREAESKEVQQDGEGEEEAAPVLPAKEHADMLNSFLQRATTSKEGGQARACPAPAAALTYRLCCIVIG